MKLLLLGLGSLGGSARPGASLLLGLGSLGESAFSDSAPKLGDLEVLASFGFICQLNVAASASHIAKDELAVGEGAALLGDLELGRNLSCGNNSQ